MSEQLFYSKEERRLRKKLGELIANVRAHLAGLDVIGAKLDKEFPAHDIAKLVNALEFANDSAIHFGLGLDIRKRPTIKQIYKFSRKTMRGE